MRTRPSLIEQLAGNKEVGFQRVLCPYHQLIAASSADIAEPAAFVDEAEFYFRSGDDDIEPGVRRHEIDLIRDSLGDATPCTSCDRQAEGRVPAYTSTTTATTPGGSLSRTLGRATHVSFTHSRQPNTSADSSNQITY